LPVENATGATVKVLDFVRSCGCLEVSPRNLQILPGDTANVRVSLDLTQQRGIDHLGSPIRSFKVQLAPILNMKAWPDKAWTIHATVRSRVTLNKFGVNFGDMTLFDATSHSQAVLATIHVPIDRVEPRVSPDVLKFKVKRSAPDANEYEILLAPRDDLPPGPFSANLVVQLISPSGEYLPGATLPI